MSVLPGLIWRIGKIRKRMLEVGAVSEETARNAKELGVDEGFLKLGLAQIHGIKKTNDGRYYVSIEKLEKGLPLQSIEEKPVESAIDDADVW